MAQSLTLKIYSTKTSLLVRSITITDAFVVSNAEYIVSYFLDPRSDDRVYIATSGSKVFLHNVATGELVQKWNIGVGHVRHVCVCAGQALSEDESEVLYVAAGHPNLMEESVWRVSLIVAKVSKTEIYRSRIPIVDLRVADAGKAVCLISGRDIAIVNSNGAKWLAPRVYKMAIELTCMDVYSGSSATPAKKGKKGGAKRGGDVVVGDTAGAIYVLHDVIKSSKVEDHTPMKLHWHRLAVSSVKWALDGMSSLTITRFTFFADLPQEHTSFPEVWRLFWSSGSSRQVTSSSCPIWALPSRTSSSLPGALPTPLVFPTTRS